MTPLMPPCIRMSALWLATLALPLAAAPEKTATLQVDVAGVRSARGQVIAALCREGQAFPSKCALGAKSDAASGVVRLEFAGLPYGTYALALYHDENANKTLELFREGIGFSRDANLGFAPPDFKASSFTVTGPTRIRVNLKYYAK